jgi:hypothetical protein
MAFVASVCVIITMYGGGFATIPAYLADIFGTQMVGAIHGRLITSWSVAGVVGPAIIAGLRETQLANGVPKNLVYDNTLYIMAGLLFCGLICNLLVRPVNEKNYMTDEELARERALQHEDMVAEDALTAARGTLRHDGAVGVARGRRPVRHRALHCPAKGRCPVLMQVRRGQKNGGCKLKRPPFPRVERLKNHSGRGEPPECSAA